MASRKIIVTGANGQLGRELLTMKQQMPGYELVGFTREELSITDPRSVSAVFEKESPAFCINCAAYTAVDRAESERGLAMAINGDAVGVLAEAAKKAGSSLIHISTDYVFNGQSASALTEEDPTDPLNWYGATKLKGEELAMAHQPDTVILRTSWVYSSYGQNFVKTMVRLMRERKQISVVDDQIGSPTYAADLAAAVFKIIESPVFIPGLFHYSNEGKISWYTFALAIREMIGADCEILPIPSSAYPTPAKRPSFSLLDKSKIKNVYGLAIPGWKESLEVCMQKIKSGNV